MLRYARTVCVAHDVRSTLLQHRAHTHTLYCNENVSVSTTSAANDHASPHVCAQKNLYTQNLSYRIAGCQRACAHVFVAIMPSVIYIPQSGWSTPPYYHHHIRVSLECFPPERSSVRVCRFDGADNRRMCVLRSRVRMCGTSPTSGDKYMALEVRA